jgi:protein-L-isoaspartate(D-aspartate) O-methyltransferase
MNADNSKSARRNLVNTALIPFGIKDKRVLEAFLKTPRHKFVEKKYQDEAYLDIPLPIGENQTISQPSLVAQMTQFLKLKGREKVLEIGTGSGYQAAILSGLAKEVYTVEILLNLAKKAAQTLKKLKYENVHVEFANGTLGLPKYAPYDAIIVTAGAKDIPKTLIDQLKIGGRMVIPVGAQPRSQELKVVIKRKNKLEIENIEPVLFVPLIGKYSW